MPRQASTDKNISKLDNLGSRIYLLILDIRIRVETEDRNLGFQIPVQGVMSNHDCQKNMNPYFQEATRIKLACVLVGFSLH